jgi:Copper amine oxidase N-terminal domain.
MKRITQRILTIVLVLSFLTVWTTDTHASGDFKWYKNVDEMTVNLESISYGNGLFVAVGEDGIIKTSPDGYEWTCRTSGTTCDLWSASWCKDRFFALGDKGLILTSYDGITWTKQEPPTKYGLSDTIWNGKQFMIVGSWGTVLTSFDGLNWKEQPPITDENYISITYCNGHYVIAAAKAIVSSEDGLNWSIQEFPDIYSFYNTSSNGNMFAITGWRYSGEDEYICIFTSKDGIQWQRDEFPSDAVLNGITSNGSSFLCAGTGMLAVSSDGTTWEFTENSQFSLQDVIFAGNKYVGVGIAGEIYVSDDGNTWQYKGPVNDIDLNDVIWANSSFIGVGGNGTSKIISSSDGEDWSWLDSQSLHLYSAVWDGSKSVAVGIMGYVLCSTDGIRWDSLIIEGNPNLTDIEWNGSLYVATGDRGEIYTSNDAVSWTRRVTRTDEPLNGVVWNGQQFVAVGGTSYSRIILNSTDGINWKTVSTSNEFYTDLRGVIWADNQFVAYGSHGYLTVSKDGSNWTPVKSQASVGINDIVWTGSNFFYIGDFGLMGSSTDGIHWKLENSGTTVTLKTICWNGEKLVAAGYKSIVLTAVPTDIVKVKVNGKPLIFDVAPVINDGRTLVPLRSIFEALGADINWNGSTKTVYATKDGMNMILKVGSSTASVNGATITLEVAASNFNGRILVPTRFIAESFGADVTWDPDTRTVIINTK